MVNLDDLINNDKEYTGLDFKRIQYNKAKNEDLIKDIMSMANADIEGDRYIIIGVYYKNSNDREIIGINKEEFVDSATYQQLIMDNIEPRIIFDYFSHEIDGKCLGIFKITQCNDQPYMMKKAFRNLRKGDCFIRKGDFQSNMIREDIDRITVKRINDKQFNGEVNICFSNYANCQEITLPTARDIELPSKREADKIQKLINAEIDRESSIWIKNSDANIYGTDISDPFLLFSDERKIEYLKEDLKNIEGKYKQDDLYEFYELRSHKLNITIMNEGFEKLIYGKVYILLTL
jgi:hypothetical protein